MDKRNLSFEEATQLVKRIKKEQPLALIPKSMQASTYIWSKIQIKALNYCRRKYKEGYTMERIYDAQKETSNRYIEIPVSLDQDSRQARINWIDDIGEGFFMAGLTIEGQSFNDPYGGGSSVWILTIEENRFIPLFNTSVFDMKDFIEKGKRILKEEEEVSDERSNSEGDTTPERTDKEG